MRYNNKKLPKGVTIWANDFGEYVACIGQTVTQYKGKNIRCGRTVEQAVQNYLNNKVR